MEDDVLIIEPIECSFRKIRNSPEEGFRFGRYSGSFHWEIKDFALKRWVVLGYLDVDWPKLKESKSEDQILLGCLQYLNKVPERKKHAKKDPKPKYGYLEPYKADFKIKNNNAYIIVQFKTNEQNNPNFWSEGQSWNGERIGKKRGRPPKIRVEQSEE